MTNRDIAAAFDEIADLLELQNANPFRVRAYRNGARRIADLSESVAQIVTDSNRDLTEFGGIGKELAEKIRTLVKTGSLPMLEELRAEIPAGVLTLIRVPGLGAKKAAILHQELGIASLEMLRAACEADQVQALKGFGRKTQEKILAGIELAAMAEDRMYWAVADEIVQELLAYLRQVPGIRQLEVAGSYRRGRETVGDIDILVDAENPSAVMDHLAMFGGGVTLIGRGDTKMSVRLPRGLQVDLRAVPPESFGAALQYFTGSKDHNVLVRGMAKDRGLKINEYGVFRLNVAAGDSPAANAGAAGKNAEIAAGEPPAATSETPIAGRTEEEVYATLGLPLFPPEIREARDEFAWAAAGKLPKLIDLADLVADLHMHTTSSDGKASLPEMVDAAHAAATSTSPSPITRNASAWRTASTRPAFAHSGKRSTPSIAGSTTSSSSKALSATSSNKAAWTCPTTCSPRPIGSSPASITASSKRAGKSPTGSWGHSRIRTSRSSLTPPAG